MQRAFLRDYREFFEKLKRDYKERVKNFQGYLDFEQSIKIIQRVFESFFRDYKENFEKLQRVFERL